MLQRAFKSRKAIVSTTIKFKKAISWYLTGNWYSRHKWTKVLPSVSENRGTFAHEWSIWLEEPKAAKLKTNPPFSSRRTKRRQRQTRMIRATSCQIVIWLVDFWNDLRCTRSTTDRPIAPPEPRSTTLSALRFDGMATNSSANLSQKIAVPN